MDGRYLVRHGYIPDEGIWATCVSFTELARRAGEVWGSTMQHPVFAYSLPSNVERGDCNVLIADEQDFAIWRFGRGNSEDPKPLSTHLHVFDKARLPRVRNTDTRGDMYSFASLDKALMHDVQVRVSLRNSAAKDIVLFGREDVIGEGCGDWGRLVIKSREVWGVRRPVFRYFDDSVMISIFNAEDYRLWSTHRREYCPELFVFEGVPICAPTPIADIVQPPATVALQSEFVHHEVVIPRVSSKTDGEVAADAVERLATEQATAHRRTKEVASSAPAANVTQLSQAERIVLSGACGPSFTTPCNAAKRLAGDGGASKLAAQRHQDDIVASLLRSKPQ